MVGIGCRFAGGASTPEALLALLVAGGNAVGPCPAQRFAGFTVPDLDELAHGAFLDDVAGFDAGFFGISPREALEMDPQQRLMLELGWEALEDAGILPQSLEGSASGVFVGCMWQDYAHRAGVPDAIAMHTAAGLDTSIIAARLSFLLGLHGPSLTVNTGCSSSLVAVHLACQSLRSGESALALAGAVNLILAPHSTVAMARFGGLSPDGSCKAFDAAANGYVRGEGGGVVVLKRLRDALRAGDQVYCVIRGSAVNNDGASASMTAPCPRAQEAVVREACRNAGVAPQEVHYVEAHGTGTRVGDPVEAEALGRALGQGRPAQRPLRIGSVKTNLGHTEGAAGLAGLIKVALAMRARVLPGNLHFNTPNPAIDFAGLGLCVQSRTEPWPHADELPLAGVSSFGFGGTNAHLIVEGAPTRAALLLVVAADDAASFRERCARLAAAAENVGSSRELAALCRASAHFWGRGRLRGALVVQSGEQAARLLRELAPKLSAAIVPCIAFTFSGESSRYAELATLAGEPAFQSALEACHRHMSANDGWSLLDAAWSFTPLAPERAEVLSTALHIAHAALWRSWGIEPDVVLGAGHGELAAAHCAGVLDLTDTLRIAAERARLSPLAQHARPLLVNALEERLPDVCAGPARVPLFSAAAGAFLHGSECDMEHWVRTQRAPSTAPDLAETERDISLAIGGAPSARGLLDDLARLYEAGVDLPCAALPRSAPTARDLPPEVRRHLPLSSTAAREQGEEPWTLVLSAHGAEALRDQAERFARHVRLRTEQPLEDIVHKAALSRSALPERLTVTASSRQELCEGLFAHARGDHFPGLLTVESRLAGVPLARHGVVFVFSGHGSQWPGMCRELLAGQPVFRDAFVEAEGLLVQHGVAPLAITLERMGRGDALRADEIQPLLFAVQVSLAALLRSWGVLPAAVIGHSVGEVAAAHVAGCLDLPEAARVMAERARAIVPALGRGGMAVVELPWAEAEALIRPHEGKLAVAVEQSPRFSVLSGELSALGQVVDALVARKVFCRWVDVDYASHGPQMLPLSQELEQRLAGLAASAATTPMISTVLGGPLAAPSDARYWAANLREPVRFRSAVEHLLDEGLDTFLELSPHPLLANALSEIALAHGTRAVCAATLRRQLPELSTLHQALGRLYVHGLDVPWARMMAPGDRAVALPTYPFQRTSYLKQVARVEHAPAVVAEEVFDERPSGVRETLRPRETWRADLATIDPAEVRSVLCELLISELSRVLRMDRARIQRHTSFASLGLDSLMGLELRHRVEAELGVAVPATSLWSHPSAWELSDHLCASLVLAQEPELSFGAGA